MTERRYSINLSERCYEDDLPEDMTTADYDEWFSYSQVDCVRFGPAVTRLAPPQNAKP